MLFAQARTPTAMIANFTAPVVLGLLYAVVALNLAAGCGHGGECLRASDFRADATLSQSLARD